jgi:hypothetical protein
LAVFIWMSLKGVPASLAGAPVGNGACVISVPLTAQLVLAASFCAASLFLETLLLYLRFLSFAGL